MPRKRPSSYEDLLTEMTADAIMDDADVMASEMGPPPGKRVSESEEVRLWGARDPSVDYATTLSTLLTQGFGETANQLVVVQENPELVAAYAEPVESPEVAEALAVLAEYPFRYGLFMAYGDPEDRVAVSNRIARAWEKQQPPAPPEPPAAPAVPSPAPPLSASGPLPPAHPMDPDPTTPPMSELGG